MYYTCLSWEELATMIRSDWAEYALHKLLKIAGVDGSYREDKGSRMTKTEVPLDRPKKPP